MLVLKKLVVAILQKNWHTRLLFELHRISRLLDEIGWQRSLRQGVPVDKGGNPLPWYCYPAITFLQDRIRSDMTVFEYGSGYSTLWWGKRVHKVVSCEHDLIWYRQMKEKLPPNVEYFHKELTHDGAYAKKILEYHGAFDVIVIDGRDRVNCARNSLGALKDNGVIIWDNSERPRYAEGLQFFRQNGFISIDFEGFGPVRPVIWRTTVFYRGQNCLGI